MAHIPTVARGAVSLVNTGLTLVSISSRNRSGFRNEAKWLHAGIRAKSLTGALTSAANRRTGSGGVRAWARASWDVYRAHPWLLAATAMRRQVMGPDGKRETRPTWRVDRVWR